MMIMVEPLPIFAVTDIVDAPNFRCGIRACEIPSVVARVGDKALRIQRFRPACHLFHQVETPRIILDGEFFIAQAPDEYAGVISVAFNDISQLTFCFGRCAEHASLVHDKHAQPVAGIEHCGGRRMMHAACVDSHLL